MNELVEGLNDIAAAWWPMVFHASWQLALVATVVLILVRFLCRLPSPLRYALVVLALAKFLVPPFLALPSGALSQLSVTRVNLHSTARPTAAKGTNGKGLDDSGHATAGVQGPALRSPASAADSVTRYDGATLRFDPATRSSELVEGSLLASPGLPRLTWQTILMLMHGLGVVGMAGWVLRQSLRVRRLLSTARRVETGPLHEMLSRLIKELGIRRPVRLFVSRDSITPMAVGVVRPTVLVPSALLERLSPREQQTILAHELAHHRRWDLWMVWLQAAVLVLWWFHPLAWLVHRALVRLREDCCDDLVLARGVTSIEEYCQALLRAVEWCSIESVRHNLAWCTAPMHPFGRRLRRVMDATVNRRSRVPAWGGIAIVLTACVVLPGVTHQGAGGVDGTSEATAAPALPPLAAAEPRGEGVDLYGDSLPAGAIARLGTVRYRHGDWSTTHVGFLRDSKTLVSLAVDTSIAGTAPAVRLWDVETGRLTGEHGGQAGTFRAVAPFGDGRSVAILGAHGYDPETREQTTTLDLWEPKSDKTRTLTSWQGPLPSCLAVSHDGKTIVTGSAWGTVHFFDMSSGELLRERTLSKFQIASVDFFRDGDRIAIATGSGGVYLWQWHSDKDPQKILDRGALKVAVSPDSRYVAMSRGDGIRLWDVAARRPVQAFSDRLPKSSGGGLAFSPDGKELAFAGSQTLQSHVVEVPSGKPVLSLDGGGLGDLVISPNGRYLAGSGGRAEIKVWDLRTGQCLSDRAAGHAGAPGEILFSPDGKRVVTGTDDANPGSVRVWDSTSGRPLRVLKHDGTVMAMAVSSDGNRIASSSLDGSVRLWDVESSKLLFEGPGHGDRGSSSSFKVAFSLDDRRVLSFGDDWNLRTWDARSGRLVGQHAIRPRKLVYQPGKDGELRAAKFRLSRYDQTAPSDAVTCARFSADRQTLLFTSWPIGGFPPGLKTNYEVDIASGRGVDQYRIDDDLGEVVVSPKGDLVATVEWRQSPTELLQAAAEIGLNATRCFLRLRNPVTKDVIREIELPGNGQHGVFSADGSRIALSMAQSTGLNQVKRWLGVWDTTSGEEIAHVEGYDGRPFALALSPDGNRLASSHEDSTVLIWDVDRFRIDP